MNRKYHNHKPQTTILFTCNAVPVFHTGMDHAIGDTFTKELQEHVHSWPFSYNSLVKLHVKNWEPQHDGAVSKSLLNWTVHRIAIYPPEVLT